MAKAQQKDCIHFSIWMDGRKIKAGALPGTAITIGSARGVLALSPQPSLEDPKNLTVSLLRLKSHEQPISAAKLVGRIETVYGRTETFVSEGGIKCEARRSSSRERTIRPLPPKGNGEGQCCVALPGGYKICATCYVNLGKYGSCCSGFWCCIEMVTTWGNYLPDTQG